MDTHGREVNPDKNEDIVVITVKKPLTLIAINHVSKYNETVLLFMQEYIVHQLSCGNRSIDGKRSAT